MNTEDQMELAAAMRREAWQQVKVQLGTLQVVDPMPIHLAQRREWTERRIRRDRLIARFIEDLEENEPNLRNGQSEQSPADGESDP